MMKTAIEKNRATSVFPHSINASESAIRPNRGCKFLAATLTPILASLGLLCPQSASAASTLTAAYLPAGPASPTNPPAWTNAAYRDVPWWFADSAGASDAYDISTIWAARFNKNGTGGYEAALINTPAPTGSAYGAGGGAFGPQKDVTWNKLTWNFTLNYSWNNGAPTGSLTYQNDTTVISTGTVSLGSRVIDFIEGNTVRPLTGTGSNNPYTESHSLNDVLLRFATTNTSTSGKNSLTVGNMTAQVDGGEIKNINYLDSNGTLQTSIKTEWDSANGPVATNPRQIQFLYLDNLLPSHQSSLTLTGQLAFDYTVSPSDISGSGLMFEVKMGDLNYFSAAKPYAIIPEPVSAVLGAMGLLLIGRRKR